MFLIIIITISSSFIIIIIIIIIIITIIIITMCLFICRSVCGPVGVEDRNKIPDARMTASTFHNSYYSPYYGRLNENRGGGAWCTKTTTDRTDYLQVDMGAVHSVCVVATQGREAGTRITSYKVYLSKDGVTWFSYKENNVEKVTNIIHACLEVAVVAIQKSHSYLSNSGKICCT